MGVSPYISSPNILDVPECTIKTVVLNYGAADVLRAGQPISEAGVAVNDATAMGILLLDCHRTLGTRIGQVVVAGRIRTDVAQTNSGVTVSDAAKSAMINIAFTGDGSRTPEGIPDYSEASAGDVLTIGDDGPEWAPGAATVPARVLTLVAEDWVDGVQTVAVPGVLADETKQLITVVPAGTDMAAYIAAGIVCTAQAEDELTFTASEVPTSDLVVYAVLQFVAVVPDAGEGGDGEGSSAGEGGDAA